MTFEEWLQTSEGKDCAEPSLLRKPSDTDFLKNRLWWAFGAGMRAERERSEKTSSTQKEPTGKQL